MARLKAAVLISGRGSNLQALIDACARPDFPAAIVTVVSNLPGAAGLARAEKAGIPTAVIDHRGFGRREEFEAALDRTLRAAGAELICLAGFMRLLTPGFVSGWRNRMINIHPSLLPSFKGLHTHRQALAAGVKIHGCTVHLVTPDLDSGPILVQAAVPVEAGDDEDGLAARVLEAEHRIYPLALRLMAEGRVVVEGDVVRIATSGAAAPALVNPAG